jgi:glycosyltransferase involved in cell wall biosynthesis
VSLRVLKHRLVFCALELKELKIMEKEIQPIDIILLTWNRKKLLKNTLQKIEERTKYPYNLIVVDNFSQDGTQDFLRKELERGFIKTLILNDENIGQTRAFNKAFDHVKSETFIVTQDDLWPPDLKPCWLEQMNSLINKYPDHGAICMRVQRIPNVNFTDQGELTPCRSACPAYLRIQRRSDILKFPNKFGDRMFHEAALLQSLMHNIKKKCSFATNIWAHHSSYMEENKGYGNITGYLGYSAERNKVPSYKPFKRIDPKTNEPLD